MASTTPSRAGHVVIEPDRCKGCALCVEACPEKCLSVGEQLNRRGTRFAVYTHGCTGCGLCFYVCPEPGAVVVTRPPARVREVA
jgi:NAD-dependent dihydropyrimidine dehydrogenase PreA subunit